MTKIYPYQWRALDKGIRLKIAEALKLTRSGSTLIDRTNGVFTEVSDGYEAKDLEGITDAAMEAHAGHPISWEDFVASFSSKKKTK